MSSNLYSQGFGSTSSNAFSANSIIQQRPPTTTDVRGSSGPYPVGQLWVDEVSQSSWQLMGYSSSGGVVSAAWTVLGGGSSALNTLTGDTGTATPSAGNIKIAGGTGISTIASGATVTVSLSGGSTAVDSINVDANTGPGTDPVLADTNGLITVTGAQVAAGTTPNVIRTDSLAANTYTIEVQRSSAQAATTLSANGVSHFDSGSFTVDANGFVTLKGGGEAIDSIVPNSGTSPVVADTNGQITIQGTGSITTVGGTNSLTPQLTGLTANNVLIGAGTATITKVAPSATVGMPLVSGGTGTDPLFSLATVPGGGTGINTATAYAPIVGGITATSPFQSASTGLSTSGFVLTSTGASSLPTFQNVSASGAITTVTGNTGGAQSPSAGNFNVLGTGSITVAGTANTETVQLTGLTNHNLLLGAGTATITNLAPSATSGIPLVSAGSSSDPAFSTAVVAGGGTGSTAFNINGVVYSNTTTTGVLQSATLSSGQLLIGGTTTPAAATLTAGTGITITNGNNSITISSPDSGITWNNVTGTSASMAVNNGYVSSNASQVQLTLPVTAAIGDCVSIRGSFAGGWKIVQNASQIIHVGSVASTTGVGGAVESANRYDCVDLTCVVTNNEWVCNGVQSAGLIVT